MDHGEESFARVHEALFHAYFAESGNIGDPDVMRTIAVDCGLSGADVETARADPTYTERLRHNHEAAAQHPNQGTPTYVIAGHKNLVGVVETNALRQALRCAA